MSPRALLKLKYVLIKSRKRSYREVLILTELLKGLDCARPDK